MEAGGPQEACLCRESTWCNESRDKAGADQAYFQVVDQTIRGALRFAPQVLGPAPLNADELIFAQIFSVPIFTGIDHLLPRPYLS